MPSQMQNCTNTNRAYGQRRNLGKTLLATATLVFIGFASGMKHSNGIGRHMSTESSLTTYNNRGNKGVLHSLFNQLGARQLDKSGINLAQVCQDALPIETASTNVPTVEAEVPKDLVAALTESVIPQPVEIATVVTPDTNAGST